MMHAYFITLYLVIGLCECQVPEVEEDQYVLNFDSPVYVCHDDVSQTFVDCSNVEVERHNETVSYMKGSFTFLKKMDSCTLVEMIVEKNSNGRVEVMVTHEICDLCAEVGENSNYYKYLKFFSFDKGCPLEGEYKIQNFIADSDDMPVNRANEARYQVTLNFYNNPDCDCKDNREFLGCLKLDFLIEPL